MARGLLSASGQSKGFSSRKNEKEIRMLARGHSQKRVRE
jgi:hypothetical protein